MRVLRAEARIEGVHKHGTFCGMTGRRSSIFSLSYSRECRVILAKDEWVRGSAGDRSTLTKITMEEVMRESYFEGKIYEGRLGLIIHRSISGVRKGFN